LSIRKSATKPPRDGKNTKNRNEEGKSFVFGGCSRGREGGEVSVTLLAETEEARA